MGYIGKVVKEFRIKRNLSRNDLAAGICSEKFLYLIEKNDRTPSADVLRLFSNRLGVNLFEYYEYVDCKEPIKVREAMYQCARLRRTSEFPKLKEITEVMKSLPDFSKNPWRYEVLVNQYCIMLFQDMDIKGTIEGVEEVIAHLEPEYADEEFTAGLYALLSTGYQMIMDIENAKRTYEIGSKIIDHTKGNSRYDQIHVSLKLTAMSLALYGGDYKEAIEVGLELVQLQEATSSYERFNITSYFLACAYYKDGQEELAFQWFDKSAHHLLMLYRPSIAYHIHSSDLFETFTNDPSAKRDLIVWLKEKYDFMA